MIFVIFAWQSGSLILHSFQNITQYAHLQKVALMLVHFFNNSEIIPSLDLGKICPKYFLVEDTMKQAASFTVWFPNV